MKKTLGIECRLVIPSDFWRVANNSLLENTAEASRLLGISEDQAVELRREYEKSKSVGGSCLADVMRRTDIGKTKLIESGRIDPQQYTQEDCLRVLPELVSKGYGIEVFTKGGRECVTAALKRTPLSGLVNGGQIGVTSVSSDYFTAHDRTTTPCYLEWKERMKKSDRDLSTYLTDREDEGIACLNAGIQTVFIDRKNKYSHQKEHDWLIVIPNLYQILEVIR